MFSSGKLSLILLFTFCTHVFATSETRPQGVSTADSNTTPNPGAPKLGADVKKRMQTEIGLIITNLREIKLAEGVVGAMLIIGGLSVCWFGIRIFKPILFSFGFGIVAVAGLSLFNSLRANTTIPSSFGEHDFYIKYGSVALVALIGGFLSLKIWNFAVAVAGAAAGGLTGAGIVKVVNTADKFLLAPKYVPLVVGGSAFAGMILMRIYEESMLIVFTAFFGAFICSCGIDVYLKRKFYVSMYIFVTGEQVALPELNDTTLVYFLFIFVSTLTGSFIQRRLLARRKARKSPSLLSAERV